MDDAHLITRLRAGDSNAERALYDAHVERVWRLAYRMLGDADAASDCVQETFVKAFARIEGFRGESALGTWIGAIAMTQALTHLRTRRRRDARHEPMEAAARIGIEPRQSDPDLKEQLAAAIAALPEGYRTVFVLHDVEGYTHEEIGGILGVEAGTSKGQLSRARARLREKLAVFRR